MTSLSPELIGLFAATTGVGYLMMTMGIQKSHARMACAPPELPIVRAAHRAPRVQHLHGRLTPLSATGSSS